MKKAVVVCILVIVLACMWSSAVYAWSNAPDSPPLGQFVYPNQVISDNGTRLLTTNGQFYCIGAQLSTTQLVSVYNLVNGNWVLEREYPENTTLGGKYYVDECNVPIYEDSTLTTIYKSATIPQPDETHYIMIGAIPHQMVEYESILVDTNWDFIKIVVKEGTSVVYQEAGATSTYSQPFSDGRLNIPLAFMGLQDRVTYVFEVYGSDDGETWWDAGHPYKMTTTFTFYKTEADEVRVMGIADGKTYAYAPMISWRKSGKYRNATLKVLLNGYQIYRGEASNGYVNLAYLPAEDKEFLKIGTGPLKENDIRVIVEQPGDDYLVGNWGFWVSHDIMDMWTDNEDQPLPGVIDWNSDESIIQQIKNTGQEAIQVVKIAFDFVPPEIMLLIILGFTLVIALRILGR